LKTSILEDLLENKNLSFFDKSFRASQIIDFVFKKREFDFNNYLNIPKNIRDQLIEKYSVLKLEPALEKTSIDGTKKILFKLNDNNFIESVILKDNKNRYTFCISSQCGCKMGCQICKTAQMGFHRNLDFIEIISQILYLLSVSKKLDNIVFMGMGEPLDNFTELVKCIKVIADKLKFSVTRITVSTCGLADKIEKLFEVFPTVRLAVSLNSSIQEKRDKIMPVSKKYPLTELFNALDRCYLKYKNRISIEYVLIKNFNMNQEDLDGFKNFKKFYHINLIPFNSSDENMKPSDENIKTFYNKLEKMGFNVTIRLRKGSDIQADCGQLYYFFKNQ